MLKQELTTSKQIVEAEQKYRRERKGFILAISRRLYRLQNSDIYYVESESCDNIYYFVKFKPDVIEFCSCMDSSTRSIRCKHSWACEYAIRMGTLKDTDRLPADAKRKQVVTTVVAVPKSYTEDDYSF